MKVTKFSMEAEEGGAICHIEGERNDLIKLLCECFVADPSIVTLIGDAFASIANTMRHQIEEDTGKAVSHDLTKTKGIKN